MRAVGFAAETDFARTRPEGRKRELHQSSVANQREATPPVRSTVISVFTAGRMISMISTPEASNWNRSGQVQEWIAALVAQ
jgi:hypothetical protein